MSSNLTIHGLIWLSMTFAAACQPASAFDATHLGQIGSLAPEDKIALLAKSPALKVAFVEAAGKLGKAPEDIPCDGQRFPGAWDGLGGTRTAPYTCQFGDRLLTIKAKVQVSDSRGRIYDRVTPAAMKRADHIDETRFTWTWSAAKLQ